LVLSSSSRTYLLFLRGDTLDTTASRSTLEEGLLTLLVVNGGSTFGFFGLGNCECWLKSALLGVNNTY